MSVARQFGLSATGGDPKLKLPLVAAVDATRKETAVKSAITQIAKIGAPSAPKTTKAKRARTKPSNALPVLR